MGVIHLGPLSALPGTCIVLRALAMLYDPGGTCTVLAYRPAHFCLRPKLEYRLPLVVLTRLNRFTLSHYGSRTPLSTLHAGLTASHARLSTGCLLGFAGSGLSPDYTIHAELAHNLRTLGAIAPSNFRTLKPQRGLSLRAPYLPSGAILHTSRGRSPQPVREASADPGQNPGSPGPSGPAAPSTLAAKPRQPSGIQLPADSSQKLIFHQCRTQQKSTNHNS